MGTMEPFSAAISSESSSRVDGERIFPGDIPSTVTIASQEDTFHALADFLGTGGGSLSYLRAGSAGRKHLGGIQESARVEDILHLHHDLKIAFAEDKVHELLLLNADAMFAAERSSGIHANFHDVAAHIENLVHLVLTPAVKQDQRMQVAVARVKDVRNRQAIAIGDPVDLGQH